MVAAMRKWLGSVPGDWTRDKDISEEEKQEKKDKLMTQSIKNSTL